MSQLILTLSHFFELNFHIYPLFLTFFMLVGLFPRDTSKCDFFSSPELFIISLIYSGYFQISYFLTTRVFHYFFNLLGCFQILYFLTTRVFHYFFNLLGMLPNIILSHHQSFSLFLQFTRDAFKYYIFLPPEFFIISSIYSGCFQISYYLTTRVFRYFFNLLGMLPNIILSHHQSFSLFLQFTRDTSKCNFFHHQSFLLFL